jgi:hypothetical protein
VYNPHVARNENKLALAEPVASNLPLIHAALGQADPTPTLDRPVGLRTPKIPLKIWVPIFRFLTFRLRAIAAVPIGSTVTN